jgi:hypothetical protein
MPRPLKANYLPFPKSTSVRSWAKEKKKKKLGRETKKEGRRV